MPIRRRFLPTLLTALLLSACSAVPRQSASSEKASLPPGDAARQTHGPSPSPQYWAFFCSSPHLPQTQGIFRYRFDPATGQLTGRTLAATASDPNFLAFSPDHRHLYASTNRVTAGHSHGSVTAFSLDPATGALQMIDSVSSAGARAVHVSVAPTDQTVLVANYAGNTVAALAIEPNGAVEAPSPQAIATCTGSGPNPRQKGPHLHSIYTSPNGRFIYSCDLGADRIRIFSLDPGTRALRPIGVVATPPGSGPRHLAFSADGQRAYLITEISSTLIVYSVNPGNGTLSQLQALSSLPPGFPRQQLAQQKGAEVQIDPAGHFLYASNRGPHSSIDLFAISPADGTLSFIADEPTGGKTPRHFTLDPTGRYLFAGNQDSGTVTLFRVDPATGRLSPTGTSLPIPAPMCTVFAPIPTAR